LGRFARINFRAKFQQDIRRPYEGVMTDEVGTMLSRRRLGFEGTLFGHFDFEIEREFFEAHLTADELDEGAASKSKWKDVSLDIDYTKAARVRLGRFKIPFGRDELTSVTRGDFVYRSLGADYLAPSRDVGIMAHGRFFNRALTYSTGIFKHDGDNARGKRSQGADRTYAARLTGRPLRHVDGLELGAAFSTSALSNDSIRPNGLRGRTVMSEDPFFDAVYVNGRRRRWETDLEWQAGAASLRAEYTQVIDQRRGQGLSAQDLPDALYTSWYVAGTCLLTGESKARPVKPHAEFLRGGVGAFELAARFEHIKYGSASGQDLPLRNPRAETILSTGDKVLTLGVNWILNRWVILQINAIREHIDDVERSPVPDGGPFWNGVLRLQLEL
jgi:phosphate-selective porin OprO/OprP